MKSIFVAFAIGLLVLTACSATGQAGVTDLPPTAVSKPTAKELKLLPTPASPGDSIVWDGLQVFMDQLEVTQEYLTDFGSTHMPPEGSKFLWVHVALQNTGPIEIKVPLLENFSILYAAAELKPTYGHRAQYTDFSTLGPVIFPGQKLDGWLRFDIPRVAALGDLRFVFLPESAQVGASYNSPNYPYAANKPTYVWNCAP